MNRQVTGLEKHPDLQKRMQHDLDRSGCCQEKADIRAKYRKMVEHREKTRPPGKHR